MTRFVIPLQEVEKNLMPGYKPQSKWAMETSATSRESLHNHDERGCFVYAGYSRTAPTYHLFTCTLRSNPPRRAVKMIPFSAVSFSKKSKAGKGTCSMRFCPGAAVQMNVKHSRSYCLEHANKVTATTVPCPATDIHPCEVTFTRRQTCSICTLFKEEAA